MFAFLKYIRPAWYFRLYVKSDKSIYNQESILKAVEQGIIHDTSSYKNENARLSDLVYQALCQGIIPSNVNNISDPISLCEITNLDSNYLFIRRNFSNKWNLYCLILRIFTFNNPLNEIISFLKFYRVKKTIHKNVNTEFKLQKSDDLKNIYKQELVSIIIPTLNRYSYLKDVFTDLSNQSYKNFEVIVCDQSDDFNEEIYKGWKFELKVIRQNEKALWKARNECIKISSGIYILLFDDDSRVKPNWISSHINCLKHFNCDISAGITETVIGNKLSNTEKIFRFSDVFDTGNSLVKRSVFSDTGLFDRQFEKQRMGDAEFGLRCYLKGHPSISNPLAKRLHLKVDTGGLREFGSWDAFRPGNLLDPRPVPSVLYLIRRYFDKITAINFILIAIVPSVIPYKYKNNRLFKYISPIIFIPLIPLLLVQIMRSWNLSSVKLKEGAMIEYL